MRQSAKVFKACSGDPFSLQSQRAECRQFLEECQVRLFDSQVPNNQLVKFCQASEAIESAIAQFAVAQPQRLNLPEALKIQLLDLGGSKVVYACLVHPIRKTT